MFEWMYKCVEFEINIEFGVITNEKYEKNIGVIYFMGCNHRYSV